MRAQFDLNNSLTLACPRFAIVADRIQRPEKIKVPTKVAKIFPIIFSFFFLRLPLRAGVREAVRHEKCLKKSDATSISP